MEKNFGFGVDIGGASLAIVAYELDGNGRTIGVPYHSLRIWQEPLQVTSKGTAASKKAARREFRGQRKQWARKAKRLRDLAALFSEAGLSASDVPPGETGDDGIAQVYKDRAAAVECKIPLPALMRVFMNIAKRRGYMGEFRAEKNSDNAAKKKAKESAETDETKEEIAAEEQKGKVREGIRRLEDEMKACGCKTLGQYLLHRLQHYPPERRHLNLKNDTKDDKPVEIYVRKKTVEEEFDAIWKVQEKAHPELVGKREPFRETLFFKRPLKSPAAMVGGCGLFPNLPRAPLAHPAAQSFRVEKQIADMRFGRDYLSPQQKNIVRDLLNRQASATFGAITKALTDGGHPPGDAKINLQEGGREGLTGNKTAAVFAKMGVGDSWENLSDNQKTTAINLLADHSPEVFSEHPDDWRIGMKGAGKRGGGKEGKERNIPAAVAEFINTLARCKNFGAFSKMDLDGGRSGYSVKALNYLTKKMRDNNLDESESAAECRHEFKLGKTATVACKLGASPQTGNTVVDVALRQFKREINSAIRELGCTPSRIVVEMTREMSQGIKKRNEITLAMRDKEKARNDAKAAVRKITGGGASDNQIRRHLLWKEQDGWCPYCRIPIGLDNAINGGEIHYEHILPRSITRLGKKRDYLVLAHRECNTAKGDQTPWQAWGDGKNPERWECVEEAAERFAQQFAARNKRKKDGDESAAESEKQTVAKKAKKGGKYHQLLHEGDVADADAVKDFCERQFAETAWLAKLCLQWLKDTFGKTCDVSVSRGLMTAKLRRKWGLHTVIPKHRQDNGLPVLTVDGEVVPVLKTDKKVAPPQKSFDDYSLDKRIDHRHHLIDAMVIGLTGRALYQKMAGKVKADGILRNEHLPDAPAGLRKEAVRLIDDCYDNKSGRFTHRPDRFPAGNFFDENAYGVRKIAKSVKLETVLAGKSAGEVSDNIATVRNDETRATIKTAFMECIAQAKAAAQKNDKPADDKKILATARKEFFQRGGFQKTDSVSVRDAEERFVQRKHLSYFADVKLTARERRPINKEVDDEMPHDDAESDGDIARDKIRREKIAEKTRAVGAEKMRKKIRDNVLSPEIRDIILSEFNDRVKDGQTPQEAMSGQFKHSNGTLIRRVLCVRDGVFADAKEIVHHGRDTKGKKTRLKKYLKPENYAYLEARADGGVELVHLHKAKPAKASGSGWTVAAKELQNARKKTPKTPKGSHRFYKNDTVLDTEDGKLFLVRHIKADKSRTLIMTPHTEAREVRNLKESDGRRNVPAQKIARLRVVE